MYPHNQTRDELWSTNKKVLLARIEPPKWIFLGGEYISALRGCSPLKFSYALEIDQVLVVHTEMVMRVPPKKLFIVKI